MTRQLRFAPFLLCLHCVLPIAAHSQDLGSVERQSLSKAFSSLKFRNVGPFRGGRSNAVTGVLGQPQVYYFGSTGGGVWKTTDAGITWNNISDGQLKTGSVGALAVSSSDPNVIYVGMGEHAVRGVMTSHGDGVYKSTDAGRTWEHCGLEDSRHIAAIRIHPTNPELVYVAVQGELYGPSAERGIYRSTDGGGSWEQVLFVNDTSGAADLSMDGTNPRILYAATWDHQRLPWKIRSGGSGSGIHKSTDGGTTWKKLSAGLPDTMGKVAVTVSPANPDVVYANIEAKQGGVFRSNNAGKTWQQVNSERVTVARAWYYIEVVADPRDEDQVYVLNAPLLKSIDGGNNFQPIPNPHTDQHDLWINPINPNNMILANDGGACITFNSGASWSPQNNQPTAQFYRVITDRQFPYRIYGGQQDNSTVSIASQSNSGGITERNWFPTAGGESAFLAFDPDQPDQVFGTSIQGMLTRHDLKTDEQKSVVVYPSLNLGVLAKDQQYRFNWNGPLAAQHQDPNVLYLGANVIFRSDDAGHSWTEISGDLTRNEPEKHGDGSEPFTNEAAGGEVYNTISYIAVSPHAAGTIWVGTDDGLVHRTDDEGKGWIDVTPDGLEECLVNCLDISTHDPNTAFAAVTRYKFSELRPMALKTVDNGKSWAPITHGIADGHFVRVIRQDPVNEQVLYAGTEGGLYISLDQGMHWSEFQLNLPKCPITDLTFRDNDLIVATSGRAFWILDDLSSIQQSGGALEPNKFAIFTPKSTTKFSSATSASASPFSGQNPLPGVIFDYHLPSSWTQDMELQLEVIREDGKIVRTLSSVAPKKAAGWAGGPSKPLVLPTKPGLNRFHWDLRADPIPGVPDVYVLGSHNGPRVTPGRYTLRLSSSEDLGAPEAEALVVPDPRIEADEQDYEAQQEALDSIREMAAELHSEVNRFAQVKAQLSGKLKLLKNMEEHTELVQLAQAASEQLKAWESQLIQRRQKTQQDVVNFPNRLNAQLLYLAGELDTNSPLPTQASLQRLADLSNQWEELRVQLDKLIQGSIADFNTRYKSSGLPAVIIPDRIETP